MAGHVGSRRGRRGGLITAALAAVVTGIVLIAFAILHQESAPAPQVAGRIDTGRTLDSGAAARAAKVIGAARPTRIRIPAAGVDTAVNAIGLNPDGSLAVPQPGPHLNEAAWFRNSPTPGQQGPAIIEGHVDSVEGESVFFRLGAVRPGNRIRVWRADGSILEFTVNAVRDYPKATFPTSVVYGGDLSAPQLRLITCSDFNETTHHHEGNEVVFSHLTRVVRPGTHAVRDDGR